MGGEAQEKLEKAVYGIVDQEKVEKTFLRVEEIAKEIANKKMVHGSYYES